MTPEEYLETTAKAPRSPRMYILVASTVALVMTAIVEVLMTVTAPKPYTVIFWQEVISSLILFGFFLALAVAVAWTLYSEKKNQFQMRQDYAEVFEPVVLKIAEEQSVEPPLVDSIIQAYLASFGLGDQ